MAMICTYSTKSRAMLLSNLDRLDDPLTIAFPIEHPLVETAARNRQEFPHPCNCRVYGPLELQSWFEKAIRCAARTSVSQRFGFGGAREGQLLMSLSIRRFQGLALVSIWAPAFFSTGACVHRKDSPRRGSAEPQCCSGYYKSNLFAEKPATL